MIVVHISAPPETPFIVAGVVLGVLLVGCILGEIIYRKWFE